MPTSKAAAPKGAFTGAHKRHHGFFERARIVASDVITPDDLPDTLLASGAVGGNQLRFAVGLTLAEVERRMIMATLEHFDGSKPQAAKTLGISLKTLYNRLKKYQCE